MLHKIVRWLREEVESGPQGSNWSRWIGKNWARLSYAVRIEPTWLEFTRQVIPIRGLASAFDGFKIVQLSDIHCSRHVTPTFLQEAVDLVLAAKPDLIALTGDFIHHGYRHIPVMADSLARLRAPSGVFAVLGNHDFSVRNAMGIRRFRHLHRAVAQALTDQGIVVLRNQSHTIERDGARLCIVGVEDLWSRQCDLNMAYQSLGMADPIVGLAHNPWTVSRLEGRRCDLMLCGHTHGGQISHPIFGRPTLSRRGKQYAEGLYQVGDTQLYVNRGVGFGFRVRYGVRPEVAQLELSPAP